jgi:hypothetical protein
VLPGQGLAGTGLSSRYVSSHLDLTKTKWQRLSFPAHEAFKPCLVPCLLHTTYTADGSVDPRVSAERPRQPWQVCTKYSFVAECSTNAANNSSPSTIQTLPLLTHSLSRADLFHSCYEAFNRTHRIQAYTDSHLWTIRQSACLLRTKSLTVVLRSHMSTRTGQRPMGDQQNLDNCHDS